MSTKVTQGTTPTACDCCAPLPCITVGLLCRTRGGTATLCGYSEYTSPSTPPKKYRTQSQGGSYTIVEYTTGSCTVSTGGGFTCTWSGSCVVNSLTCVNDNAGLQDCGAGPVTNCGNLGSEFAAGSPYVTETATRRQAHTTGTCETGVFPHYKYTAAGQFSQLSTEDTEANAIARLLAGAGGVWSSYTSVSNCGASWEQRTTTFSFQYTEAEFKATATGLAPDTDFRTFVNIYRRQSGSGSYTLFATQELSGTSDGAGNFEIGPFDVPNAEGFETYAAAGLCPSP